MNSDSQISTALMNIKYEGRSKCYELKSPMRMIFIAEDVRKVFNMCKILNLTRWHARKYHLRNKASVARGLYVN